MREVAGFDNGKRLQVKIKAGLLCIQFDCNRIFTVNSYKVLITFRIGDFMSLEAFTKLHLVSMTEANLFSLFCFCSLFLAVYGIQS